MKAYFYGPITQSKIIRKIDTNIYNDPSIVAGYIIKANLGAGNGTFKLDDIVYQGDNYTTATAYGKVSEWKPEINLLQIGAAQGQFTANSTVRSLSSNAAYNLASFDSTPLKLVNIHIEPNPVDAELGDDYGYTTTITEWPLTE
jgi:hypothetical protein